MSINAMIRNSDTVTSEVPDVVTSHNSCEHLKFPSIMKISHGQNHQKALMGYDCGRHREQMSC